MSFQELRWKCGMNSFGSELRKWESFCEYKAELSAPKKTGEFLVAEELLASQEGPGLLELANLWKDRKLVEI